MSGQLGGFAGFGWTRSHVMKVAGCKMIQDGLV